MYKKCIYFSRFIADAGSSGGSRRSAQLLREFSFLFPEVVTSCVEKSYLKRLENKIKFLIASKLIPANEYKLWEKDFQSTAHHLHASSHSWVASVLKDKTIDLALVDDPILFSPIVKALKKKGIKIIGFSHNLESTVLGQFNSQSQFKLFEKEINMMSLCDLIITISREETCILDNFGINAVFFPYYPNPENFKRLESVRSKRANSTKHDVLMLGTASNKPTLVGMKHVISSWEKYKIYKHLGSLIVVGFGTEKLKKIAKGQGIKFLGYLPDEDLNNLLSQVRACICYQKRGAGSLTRIIEMLIAGIPVLANSHAARSYYNIKGVIEFHSFDSLKTVLNYDEFKYPNIPIPKTPDSFLLKTAILNL